MAMLRGNPSLDQTLPHRCSGGRILSRAAVEDLGHKVEAPDLFLRAQVGIIGDVVGGSGEAVEGVDMLPQIAPDQKGSDREILAAPPFPRGGLYVPGGR